MRPESARALKYSGESAGGLALTGVVDSPSGDGGVEPSSFGGDGGSWNKGPLLNRRDEPAGGLAMGEMKLPYW